MRLILIRHGQTEWNRQRKYCGSTDVNLSEEGRQQGELLSQRLEKEKIDKVYSSNMKRARNFCNIVLKNTACEEIFGLREINFGILEGLTYQEAMKKLPGIYEKWLDNPLVNHIPGAESLNNFAVRVRQAFLRILSLNEGRSAALFTHAGPLRIILSDLLKVGLKDIWQIKQDSGNINIIVFKNAESKILLQNDTSYLNPK
ncbi:MAG: histidine phosphatase family protein [Candidatus Omnitrophica bacterium]|nr:histidine phosphatase family protein [Candidatus Omnitrophota bacterium]